jgi:hypothetical protein
MLECPRYQNLKRFFTVIFNNNYNFLFDIKNLYNLPCCYIDLENPRLNLFLKSNLIYSSAPLQINKLNSKHMLDLTERMLFASGYNSFFLGYVGTNVFGTITKFRVFTSLDLDKI